MPPTLNRMLRKPSKTHEIPTHKKDPSAFQNSVLMGKSTYIFVSFVSFYVYNNDYTHSPNKGRWLQMPALHYYICHLTSKQPNTHRSLTQGVFLADTFHRNIIYIVTIAITQIIVSTNATAVNRRIISAVRLEIRGTIDLLIDTKASINLLNTSNKLLS